MTPQPRQKGLFGLRLTASDGIDMVESASVYQEPEGFDLTIDYLDRNGAAARAFGFRPRPASGERIEPVEGTSRFRLEKGQYHVQTLVFGAEGTFAAPRPRIALDQDTTVTLDGRLSRPVTVAVDQPAAVPWLHSGT